MRRKSFFGAAVLAGSLCSCEALYGGYSIGNSNNCVVNPMLCTAPDQACNPLTRDCEPAILVDTADPPAASTEGGDVLTLSGQRFSADLRVRIGGLDAGAVTLISDRSLSVVVPASVDARGSVAIEVSHPAGQTVRKEGLFRYFEPTRFGTAPPVMLSFTPKYVRSVDCNRDGRADLVMTDGFGSSVYALLAQADGSLSAPLESTLAARAFGLALGDVNGDGIPDLAVSQTGPMSTIEVALGTGTGRFVSSTSVITQNTVGALALGDVDSDGKADLTVSDDTKLRVWIGQGNGLFAASSKDTPLAYQGFASGAHMLLRDLDGDSALDIITTNGSDLNFPILFGDGKGTFSDVTSQIFSFAAGAISVADADADGLPDILVGLNGNNPSAALMLQGPGRSFRPPMPLSGSRNPNSAELQDLNGDGTVDVLIFSAVAGSNALAILHAISPARYVAPKIYALPPFPSSAVPLQLDGDSKLELFVVHRGAGGSGNFYSVLPNVTP